MLGYDSNYKRVGVIHYLADPIRIMMYDTQSDTYHDTLLFSNDL